MRNIINRFVLSAVINIFSIVMWHLRIVERIPQHSFERVIVSAEEKKKENPRRVINVKDAKNENDAGWHCHKPKVLLYFSLFLSLRFEALSFFLYPLPCFVPRTLEILSRHPR